MKIFYLAGCVEITSGSYCRHRAKMGVLATPAMEPKDDQKMCQPNGHLASLPKHSYWFDLWMFLVFDIILFLFVYFVVP